MFTQSTIEVGPYRVVVNGRTVGQRPTRKQATRLAERFTGARVVATRTVTVAERV